MKSFFLKFRAFSFVLSFLAFSLVALAINTVDTGYKVLKSTVVEIDAHTVCNNVNNNSANDYFVPTKTDAEWSAFRSNLPASVTLTFCQSNPTNITVSHSSGSRYFTVSWTAGTGNGDCQIQYQNTSGTWITKSTYSCDSNITSANQSIQDNIGSSWNGRTVRLRRVSDGTTFAASGSLACAVVAGTSSANDYDEDCDGTWNETVVTLQQDWTMTRVYSNGQWHYAQTQVHASKSCKEQGYKFTSHSCSWVVSDGGYFYYNDSGDNTNYAKTIVWSPGYTGIRKCVCQKDVTTYY